jgi:predicted secreted protein
MKLIRTAFAVVALVMALAVQAQQSADPTRYNSVDLQADAQREVPNDLVSASLYVEMNDASPARLADALNRALNDALAAAGEFKTVRAHSGGSRTMPVYDRTQRLTGWRGRAELRLESRDFAAAAVLIGKLESSLQLGSIGFSVAPEARKQVQDELIAEAIGAFRARADIVRRTLDGRSYKIRRMNVNAGGVQGPRPLIAAARPLAAEAVAAPQLEGGTSQIAVTVSGTIEIE